MGTRILPVSPSLFIMNYDYDFPLIQQTAAFLLWYHALEGGEEMVAEMASNNIINICLTIMDSVDASTVDKSCAAGGIFM